MNRLKEGLEEHRGKHLVYVVLLPTPDEASETFIIGLFRILQRAVGWVVCDEGGILVYGPFYGLTDIKLLFVLFFHWLTYPMEYGIMKI